MSTLVAARIGVHALPARIEKKLITIFSRIHFSINSREFILKCLYPFGNVNNLYMYSTVERCWLRGKIVIQVVRFCKNVGKPGRLGMPCMELRDDPRGAVKMRAALNKVGMAVHEVWAHTIVWNFRTRDWSVELLDFKKCQCQRNELVRSFASHAAFLVSYIISAMMYDCGIHHCGNDVFHIIFAMMRKWCIISASFPEICCQQWLNPSGFLRSKLWRFAYCIFADGVSTVRRDVAMR